MTRRAAIAAQQLDLLARPASAVPAKPDGGDAPAVRGVPAGPEARDAPAGPEARDAPAGPEARDAPVGEAVRPAKRDVGPAPETTASDSHDAAAVRKARRTARLPVDGGVPKARGRRPAKAGPARGKTA